MKVQLSINDDNPRSGHLVLDPIKNQASISCLDDHVDDAEVDELIAYDVIDYLPANELNDILDNWIRKIRHGGKLYLRGVDMREVAKSLLKQEITLDTANILLYGAQRAPWEYRKATLTLQKVLEVLENRGFKIIHKRLIDYTYNIVAERP